MIKVLSIGQLPKEVGGSYTTGVTRVVHALSKQTISGVQQFLYATNVKNTDAKKQCSYPFQYIGYRLLPFTVLLNIICHPLKTIKQWRHYKNVCHESPIRFEVYKANYEKAIRSIKPDIIHLHGFGISPLHYINEKYHIPIVRTFHGVPTKQNSIGLHTDSAWETAIATRTFADYDTALNENNKKNLINLGISGSNITLIPNGVDTDVFAFSEKYRDELRRKNGAKEGTIVFITCGLLIDRKGQLSFLKILRNSGIDYQYWMLGDGPDKEAISEYIDKNHLENKAKLLGQVSSEELAKYLSGADIYSHASTTEAQSLAEIEAYSTGLRIVVNSLISDTVIGDVNNDKDNYYILDFSKPDMAMFKAWANSPVSARESRKYYDWSVVANKYGELYKSIYAQTNG